MVVLKNSKAKKVEKLSRVVPMSILEETRSKEVEWK